MPKVSVLMPAYNAEKYISIAIESVLNQSFVDLELVIVDDCSVDDTGAICDRYARKDSRVKIYHMLQNVGIARAKNAALDRATGEFVAFCDDDDVMEPEAIAENLELAEKYCAQIVRWSYKTIKVDEDDKIYQVVDCICETGAYCSRSDIFKNYDNVHSMLSCDWTGLYQKSFLDQVDIRFNEEFLFGGEDTLFNIELLEHINCLVMNDHCQYNWYLRKAHSTTAKKNVNFCYSMIKVANTEKDIISKYCADFQSVWSKYAEFYKQLILDYAKKLSEKEYEQISELVRSIY